MRLLKVLVIFAITIQSQLAGADGFKLTREGNQIVGKNTENSIPDYLFGHNFDFVNNIDGTYESSHGSVDANDPGSGFNFPSGGPNDSFTYNIRGLWAYSAGEALPATSGVTLNILKASNGAPIAEIDGPIATPASFSIAATSTHELIWSVPQASTVDVLGLAFTISGTSAANGQAYEKSKPFVVVQWTPQFAGDIDEAMQAIYQTAINTLTGDFNGDGLVNTADYTVWRDGLSSKYTSDHYNVWKSHFGNVVERYGTASIGNTVSVPEPTGVVPIMLGVFGLVMRVATKASAQTTSQKGPVLAESASRLGKMDRLWLALPSSQAWAWIARHWSLRAAASERTRRVLVSRRSACHKLPDTAHSVRLATASSVAFALPSPPRGGSMNESA